MNKRITLILALVVVIALSVVAFVYERKIARQEPDTTVSSGPDIAVGSLATTAPFATTSTTYGSVLVGSLQDDRGSTTTFSVRASAGNKNMLVFKGNNQLATLPWPAGTTKRTILLGQIGQSMYVGQFLESYSGYTIYNSGAVQVAEVNITTGKVKVLAGSSDEFITAVLKRSTGNTVMALLNYNAHNLRVASTDGKQNTTIPLPVTFTQFGDMYFSGDGNKLAFSASFGIPGAERGAAFITAIDKPFLEDVGESTKRDSYMHVVGWKGNNALDMIEKASPLLNGF